MTSREWLLRCGLEQYTFAMEEAGYTLAKHFQGFSKSDFKEKCEIKDEAHLLIMETLVKNDGKRGDVLQGFLKPTRPRIVWEFLLAYPAAPVQLAASFAVELSDRQGRGLVSLTQLLRHFQRHPKVEEAVGALKEELLEAAERLVVPEPEPDPPEPTDWVVGWLKDAGMERYVQAFVDEDMKTREDLTRFTISEEQLETVLGVKQMGHRRLLLEKITKLT